MKKSKVVTFLMLSSFVTVPLTLAILIYYIVFMVQCIPNLDHEKYADRYKDEELTGIRFYDLSIARYLSYYRSDDYSVVYISTLDDDGDTRIEYRDNKLDISFRSNGDKPSYFNTLENISVDYIKEKIAVDNMSKDKLGVYKTEFTYIPAPFASMPRVIATYSLTDLSINIKALDLNYSLSEMHSTKKDDKFIDSKDDRIKLNLYFD